MSKKCRKIRIIVFTVVLILGLTSCSGTFAVSESLEAGLSVFQKKETIYFWYADESLSDYFQSAAVTFGEKKNVRVFPVLVSESEYLEAIYAASLQKEEDGEYSEQIPDVFMVSNDSLEKAYLAGLASCVEDPYQICNTEYFSDTALDAVTYQGKQVAYPFNFETSVLLYNATYQKEWALQQAQKEIEQRDAAMQEPQEEEELQDEDSEALILSGTGPDTSREAILARMEMSKEELTDYYLEHSMPHTVDDILNIGDTFDVPDGVEGIMKWDVSDIFYNYWFVGEHITVGNDTGDDPTAINIDNEAAVSCLEVYKKLNQFFSIESDTVSFESVAKEFIDGKIVFTIATTDILRRLEEAKADGSLNFEIGLAQIPAVSNELDSRSLSVTGTLAVNGFSAQKELANEFASFLVTECSEELYERTGKLSANIHANAENELIRVFKEEYAKSSSLPKMMSTGNFWIQLEVLFAKVWNGEDAAALLNELQEQMIAQTQEGR